MEVTLTNKKKFISDVNYNKSAKPCVPCAEECKKINNRINKRKLSEINTKDFPHILKVFNVWPFLNKSAYVSFVGTFKLLNWDYIED